ncbi:MAG TPA: 5'-methylthioadenosine/S-adenosylhomocysteine nucleosidase [Candidatus Saccharimonadales bacterium]
MNLKDEKVVVLVSANAEWQALLPEYPHAKCKNSPFGQYFAAQIDGQDVTFIKGGWGKISAAASAQYVIDQWHPKLLINIGTCGGFAGHVEKGEVLLVDKTIVYDIIEQMGDSAEAIADYTTDIDVSWVGDDLPSNVRKGMLLSADRDILREELPRLKDVYQGIAADWESGAIAWVAHRNKTPLLILRGVSDVVSEERAEAYGGVAVFEAGTRQVMSDLNAQLPYWLAKAAAR